MSHQKENYEIYNICLFILGLTFVTLLFDWSVINGLLHVSNNFVRNVFNKFFGFTHNKLIIVRFLYFLSTMAVFYMKPPINRNTDRNKPQKTVFIIFIFSLFFIGYSDIQFYDLYFYPILLFLVTLAGYLFFTLYGKVFKDQEIFGISNEKQLAKLSYSFNTDKGVLTVHSAEQHMYVQGGTGAGKSDSVLKPTLYQHVFKDLPALIYDYKGNPATLGKTAHTAFVHASLENKKLKTKLKYLNFSDITRSHRVNPFSKKYLHKKSDIEQLVSTLLKNYNASFRNPKDDFWFQGASAIWVGLIIRILNDRELSDELCLPLLIELLLTDDHQALIEFIKQDEEAMKPLSSIVVAQGGSSKQYTGYITSANGFCSKLVDKEIYWLMSSDDVNLNINHPEEPTFFCVAAVEGKGSVYSPLCAVVIDLVSNYFLEQNKLPTLFQLDEIYTLYLENLPMQANVFRSNGICLQIGNQLYSQMQEMFDKKADIIIGACGNQFYGQSSDAASSKMLVELLSDVDKHSVSISTSESGISQSESLRRQKAKEIRDLASQQTGEFTGKIANGKPAFFNAKFDRYPYHSEEVDIPPFVESDINTDELQRKVHINYRNICNLAKNIIDKHRSVELISE